jgi:hypothetical protein
MTIRTNRARRACCAIYNNMAPRPRASKGASPQPPQADESVGLEFGILLVRPVYLLRQGMKGSLLRQPHLPYQLSKPWVGAQGIE